MAAPEHVPTKPAQLVRSYVSPPRRAGSWIPDRPGEIHGLQPKGDRLGTPGPDQGYALKLASQFEGKLHLEEGEHQADALTGGSAIAMKRSALLGRAPVIHDLTVGLGIWGFLDEQPDPELVALRREWFEEIHHSAHHYPELRRVVDAAPEEVLVLSHTEILERHQRDWRSCLDLDV